MDELPRGTVTFLFTDIEGSTRLLKTLGDRYADALAAHQRILRESFAAHGGREVDTQGDSFFAVFPRAADAVASAIDAQRALSRHDWPADVELHVRMGLHTGEPHSTGERYVGFGVHRAARVGAVGHGGQILLSNPTRELVEDELPPQTRLRDLGLYRLKDVDRPEHLFQVESDGLRREFPPLVARRIGGPSRMRRVLLVAAVLAGVLAVSAVSIRNATKRPPLGSEERPITIGVTWTEGDPDYTAFAEALGTLEDTTGIHTTMEELAISDFSQAAGAVERDPPAVALVSPATVAELARTGVAEPLASLGIAEGALVQSYGREWIDLARVDGEVYGFPAKANSKSLLWHRPDDFRRLGLTVPETWRELMSVIDRIQRSGETAWALSARDSWTLTDWFENVYLQTAGPWRYDALFAGRLPFDDRSVEAALEAMFALLGEGSVLGGTEGALETEFGDAIFAVFGEEPSAHLYLQGGFVGPLAVEFVEPTPQPGRTIAAAPFPALRSSAGSRIVVAADFVVALSEGEAVEKLLLYLASAGAGRIEVSTGGIVSPHRLIGLNAYPNALVRAEARQLIGAETVRFDGSDLLPGTLGADFGLTLQEILREPSRTDELLQEMQRKAASAFAAG